MNQQPQPVISSYNMLPVFKTSKVMFILSFIIFVMIIGMFMIIYNIKTPSNVPSLDKTNEQVTYNILIVMFILMLVVAICIKLMPESSQIFELFYQIKWVFIILLYTIGLILFFRLTPLDTINKYANVILITSASIGLILFYIAITTTYIYGFNVNYERIKYILLLFLFIVIITLFYTFNPGGYITKYFGFTMLFTVILVILALLYVIILIFVPDSVGVGAKNLLSNFTNFTVYSSILFVIFLITMTIIIARYPGGITEFTKNKNTSWGFFLFILIVILWVILIGANLFDGSSSGTTSDKIDLFKKALLYLSGLILSGLLIFYIAYNIEYLSSKKSNIPLFILNILIVIIVLALIYRTMNVRIPDNNMNSKKNVFFKLIIDLLFYIPCLFSNTFDSVLNYSNKSLGVKGPDIGGPGYFTREKNSFIMLFVAIILIVIYIFAPVLYNKILLQGGELLVNMPVNTNKTYSLGTYEELNGSDTFDYQYAISSWFFINSDAPNTNESYNKYTSILNFGSKPNIQYNGSTNSLMVTMEQKDLKQKTTNNLLEFDEEGNRILFIKHGILLQKWNNIIINYNGGILDIFLNGELVKSDIGVVPYYTLDNLTIGQDGGINGGMCNVVYFKKTLSAFNIYLLYNMIKSKTPPISKESNLTIMKQNLQTLNNSYEDTYNETV
jgi:hypothetical protein